MPEALRRQLVDLIIQYDAQCEFSTALHPLNEKEEKEKFLRGDVRCPTFQYKKPEKLQFNFPNVEVEDEIDQLYVDRIEHTKALGALLQAVGDDEHFTRLSKAAFPVHIISALNVHVEEPATLTLSTEEIVTAFQDALNSYGLSDWNVEVHADISSRMFVNQWKKIVGIRKGLMLAEEELAGLIRHEIGVHVLRSVNGQKQQEPLLHVGTRNGRLFEEGIACYMENSDGPWRIFLRHHAVCLAQTRCFRDTWNGLVALGLSDEDAWSATLRVKRGLAETCRPGGFTRDALYALAFLDMQKYAKAGGKVEPLLSAPIAPDEIDLLNMEVFPLPGILGA